MIMDLGPDDVGYVCMPLFHSNAVQVGLGAVARARRVRRARPAVLARRGWLPDVRRYGATYFNYTGKPLAYLLATPEQPDDADNPLRVAFGNEGSPEVVERVRAPLRRRGHRRVRRDRGRRRRQPRRRRARRRARPGRPDTCKVVDEDGNEKPRARASTTHGRLLNADECVGEIVNTAGVGPFEGYYNNPEANERTTRFGWYWSGDLGYIDDDGYLYFAGRNADWIRVDGENFPAGPIEDALRAPSRRRARRRLRRARRPGRRPGDGRRSCCATAPRSTRRRSRAWLDAQADDRAEVAARATCGSLREPPTTGTNKIVKRTLVHQKFRADRVDGDARLRAAAGATTRTGRFTADDERALHESFVHYRRERFWDL